MKWLVTLTLTAAVAAQAQVVCDQPRPRDTAPLLKAIQEDDAMASVFDVTAGACVSESAACDAQKLKCGDQLTTTLQRQVNVDNGMWLRDMLLPFLGQRYTMVTNIATTEVAQDVSCNSDGPSLKAAGIRRRQLAQRRRDLVNEYPKWAMWASGVAQKCKIDANAVNRAQADAAAAAKAQADAALAAKQAEELRQDNVKKAEQAAKDKIEAEKRAKEAAAREEADKIKKQQEAQADMLRKQQEAQAEMLRKQKEAQEEAARKEREARMTEAERAAEAVKRAEAEKKRQAEEAERKRLAAIEEAERKRIAEEERKKREAQALADANFIKERESKKTSAEKRADELRAAEEARRLAAEKQIAVAENVDRSDERLKGSLAAQATGGYMSLAGPNAGGFVGALIQARYGIWMTAPAAGMASGFEMAANASFLALVSGGSAQHFTVNPDLRWYFARVGVGASFELRYLSTPLTTTDPQVTYALGINAAIAIVDNPDGRFVIVLRWMPFLNNGVTFMPERLTAEAQIGYKWFSASLQGGTVTVRNVTSSTIGWFVGLGLGGRLRF